MKPIFETLVVVVGDDRLDSSLWISNLNEKPALISDVRAKKHRELLEQAHLKAIIRIDTGTKTDRIVFVTQASFFSTEEKSYVYSLNPPAPLLKSLDDGSSEFKPYVSYYKHMEGNWYLEYATVNG